MKRIYLLLLLSVFIAGLLFLFNLNGADNFDLEGLNLDFNRTVKNRSPLCNAEQSVFYYYYGEDEWTKNNKFGLYIYAENENFFELAQKLVNSNGGEWGYVLIPYNVKDYDTKKWGKVFQLLANKKLIPVIQLWDVDPDKYKDQTKRAAKFLDTFLWPIKPRYISVYNEVNDPNFWYGKADPREYAEILDFTIRTFKEVNPDFFMMNGAFNVSAPNDGFHIDAFTFMKKMDEAVPGIFDRLDGWASHPYPQPNFSGNVWATGRWSIRAYEDELEFLKNTLSVKKELPVFITETGWAHAEGETYNNSYLPVDKVSENFRIAFENIWLKDDRVRAVMPFTIKYDPPHDHFSWVNRDNVPYKHYDTIRKIKKVAGNPPMLKIGTISPESCND